MIENVKRGIKFLNENRPGWYKEINLEVLDMNDPYLCIIGQLYGSFNEHYTDWCVTDRLGFSTDLLLGESYQSAKHKYDELKELWKKEILSLREKDGNVNL